MISRANVAVILTVIFLVVIGAIFQTARLAAPQPLESETYVASPIATPIATPSPKHTLEPPPAPIAAEGVPDLSNFISAMETEHFVFYAEPDSYALKNIDGFATQAEALLQEMSDKLGEGLKRRVAYYLSSSSQGSFSALSFSASSLVYQPFTARSGKERTRALTAHELAHQITFQSLGYPNSMLHLEGIAQWASEPLWISAEGKSFDDRARRDISSAKALPLNSLSYNRSLWKGGTQAVAYDEAGSFVGYLIRAYGLERFKQAYIESNYEGIYGKGLQDLEKDWQGYLNER